MNAKFSLWIDFAWVLQQLILFCSLFKNILHWLWITFTTQVWVLHSFWSDFATCFSVLHWLGIYFATHLLVQHLLCNSLTSTMQVLHLLLNHFATQIQFSFDLYIDYGIVLHPNIGNSPIPYLWWYPPQSLPCTSCSFGGLQGVWLCFTVLAFLVLPVMKLCCDNDRGDCDHCDHDFHDCDHCVCDCCDHDQHDHFEWECGWPPLVLTLHLFCSAGINCKEYWLSCLPSLNVRIELNLNLVSQNLILAGK